MSKTFLEALTNVGKNLQSGIDQLNSTKLDYVNVKEKGAKGDGATDDSEKFNGSAFIVPDGLTYAVDKDTLLGLNRNKILGTGNLKWKDFSTGINVSADNKIDGVIPVEKMSDVIYLSMNMPGEGVQNSMPTRINGGILYPITDEYNQMLGIGAIYRDANATLPDTFTLCVGKMKLFVLDAVSNTWSIVEESLLPKNTRLYEETWSNGSKDASQYTTTYEDHIEVSLTPTIFDGYILHFWGNEVNFSDLGGAEHIKAVAFAFDFWVKEDAADGMLVANSGVDIKNTTDTSIWKQAYTTSNKLVRTYRRTIWGHNVSNKNYDSYIDSKLLLEMYNYPIDTSLDTVVTYSSKYYKKCKNDITYNYYHGSVDLATETTESSDGDWSSRIEINPIKRLSIPVNTVGKSANLLLATITQSSTKLILAHIRIMITGTSSYSYGEFIVRVVMGSTPTVTITEVDNGSLARAGMLKAEVVDTTVNLYLSAVNSYEQSSVFIDYMYSDITNTLAIEPVLFKKYTGYSTTNSTLWTTDELTGTVTSNSLITA